MHLITFSTCIIRRSLVIVYNLKYLGHGRLRIAVNINSEARIQIIIWEKYELMQCIWEKYELMQCICYSFLSRDN